MFDGANHCDSHRMVSPMTRGVSHPDAHKSVAVSLGPQETARVGPHLCIRTAPSRNGKSTNYLSCVMSDDASGF